jgi:hypothetical protein
MTMTTPDHDDRSPAARWKGPICVGLLILAPMVWAICPPQFQEQMVIPGFSSATSTLTNAVTAVDDSLASVLTTESQRLSSAIAVLTKQKALMANAISTANHNVAQVTAAGLNTLDQNDRIAQARFDFGGEFGQGYSPCAVTATRQAISDRSSEVREDLPTRVQSEILAAPGHFADPVQAQQQELLNHQPFCTADQAASGLCTLGTATSSGGQSLAGADLNVGTLFTPSMENETLYTAKTAFINNVVGLPDGALPPGASVNSASVAAYELAKAKKDAIVSPALVALESIKLDYSGISTGEGGSDLPLATYYDNEVKRYGGNSAESTTWAGVLSGQNERGLLIELLKIKALDLSMQEETYRSDERMEAMVASLVANAVTQSHAFSNARATQQQAEKQSVMQQVQ